MEDWSQALVRDRRGEKLKVIGLPPNEYARILRHFVGLCRGVGRAVKVFLASRSRDRRCRCGIIILCMKSRSR